MYEKGYITEEECANLNLPPDYMKNDDWGQDIKIAEIPMKSVEFVEPNLKIKHALDMMTKRNCKVLPVMDSRDFKVKGTVS